MQSKERQNEKTEERNKRLLYSRQGNEQIILRLMGSCFKYVNKLRVITLVNKLIFHLEKQTIKRATSIFRKDV